MGKNRTPISLRLDSKIYRSWHRYCEISRGWGYIGRMCEDAFVEYMMNHPVDECRVEVQVEMGNQLHEVQRELSNQILCKNIENCLWLLSDKDCKDRGSPFLVKEELLGHVKEAVKIKNPSQTLIELLQRVREERHLE